MKNAFADGQSSKSPQFLSGPNGSNPASAVAVAVGGVEVSVGVVGSIGGGVGAGGAVGTVATVGVGGNTVGVGVWVEDASGAGVRLGITTGVGCSAVVAIGAGVDTGVAIGIDVAEGGGSGEAGAVVAVTTITAGVDCWTGDIVPGPESADPPDPTARGVSLRPVSLDGSSGVGVAVTMTVWKITIGVAVNVGNVIIVGDTPGVAISGSGSVPQPARTNSASKAGATIWNRRALVAVPGVVVLPTVVPRVIRSAFRRAMFVVMGGIKCSVARMDRMVVSE